MAAAAETSFNALLSADSAVALPDTDKDVVTMLVDYGATFVKRKNAAADRLDLLAGLLWLHAHKDDLAAAWPVASPNQHRRLAVALRLDLDKDGASPTWLDLVLRRLLGNIAPGATPQKHQR